MKNNRIQIPDDLWHAIELYILRTVDERIAYKMQELERYRAARHLKENEQFDKQASRGELT